MILFIDNYDSFTYNLVQAVESLGFSTMVIQNDNKINLDDLNPDKIIISPGPGKPENSGISIKVIEKAKRETPILGICLGHQCIGSVYGASICQSNEILHGQTSMIHHKKTGLFSNLPSPFQAARYHSLALESVPEKFNKTAWSNDEEIMGIQHKSLPLFGVQFHPESFLTTVGSKILENFLNV